MWYRVVILIQPYGYTGYTVGSYSCLYNIYGKYRGPSSMEGRAIAHGGVIVVCGSWMVAILAWLLLLLVVVVKVVMKVVVERSGISRGGKKDRLDGGGNKDDRRLYSVGTEDSGGDGAGGIQDEGERLRFASCTSSLGGSSS